MAESLNASRILPVNRMFPDGHGNFQPPDIFRAQGKGLRAVPPGNRNEQAGLAIGHKPRPVMQPHGMRAKFRLQRRRHPFHLRLSHCRVSGIFDAAQRPAIFRIPHPAIKTHLRAPHAGVGGRNFRNRLGAEGDQDRQCIFHCQGLKAGQVGRSQTPGTPGPQERIP